jgi:hypothetical protein
MPFGPFLALASYLTVVLPHPSFILNMFFMWEEKLLIKLAGLS